MLFSLFVCGDIGTGEKCNFELAFNGKPTMEELHARTVEAFTVAKQHLQPRDPTFTLSGFSIYDADADEWTALHDESQLFEQCQLYAQSFHGTDVAGAVPVPVLPPHALPPGTTSSIVTNQRRSSNDSWASSPRSTEVRNLPPAAPALRAASRSLVLDPPPPSFERSAVPATTVLPATAEVSMRLFTLLDKDRDGIIALHELRDAMLCCQMDVSSATVGDTFSWGDHEVNTNEFRGFVTAYPAIARELARRLDCEASARHEHESRVVPSWSPMRSSATDLSALPNPPRSHRRSVPPPSSTQWSPQPSALAHSTLPPRWHSVSAGGSAADVSLAHREAALLRELEMVRRERALLEELRRRDHPW